MVGIGLVGRRQLGGNDIEAGGIRGGADDLFCDVVVAEGAPTVALRGEDLEGKVGRLNVGRLFDAFEEAHSRWCASFQRR